MRGEEGERGRGEEEERGRGGGVEVGKSLVESCGGRREWNIFVPVWLRSMLGWVEGGEEGGVGGMR